MVMLAAKPKIHNVEENFYSARSPLATGPKEFNFQCKVMVMLAAKPKTHNAEENFYSVRSQSY
jgi:hypothetical protein